jgi:hypothetical protein
VLSAGRTCAALPRTFWQPFPCRLFSFDWHQHLLLLPGGDLARLLALCRGFGSYALFERVHEVHDVLAARAWFEVNGLAVALSVNKFRQSLFVVILKLLGLKVCCLLIDDVLREVGAYPS